MTGLHIYVRGPQDGSQHYNLMVFSGEATQFHVFPPLCPESGRQPYENANNGWFGYKRQNACEAMVRGEGNSLAMMSLMHVIKGTSPWCTSRITTHQSTSIKLT